MRLKKFITGLNTKFKLSESNIESDYDLITLIHSLSREEEEELSLSISEYLNKILIKIWGKKVKLENFDLLTKFFVIYNYFKITKKSLLFDAKRVKELYPESYNIRVCSLFKFRFIIFDIKKGTTFYRNSSVKEDYSLPLSFGRETSLTEEKAFSLKKESLLFSTRTSGESDKIHWFASKKQRANYEYSASAVGSSFSKLFGRWKVNATLTKNLKECVFFERNAFAQVWSLFLLFCVNPFSSEEENTPSLREYNHFLSKTNFGGFFEGGEIVFCSRNLLSFEFEYSFEEE